MLLLKHSEAELIGRLSIITPDFEALSLWVSTVIFSVCYRRPNGNIPKFLEFYESFLAFITENKYDLIAGGDFNIDVSASNKTTRDFNTVINTNGFDNVISQPTRITTGSEPILDLLITNFGTSNVQAGAIYSCISDHVPVFLCINLHRHSLHKREETSCQEITTATLHAFRNATMQVD